MPLGRVDAGRCVLRDEVQHIVVYVVARVPRIAVCIHASDVPVLRWALLSVGNPSTIGVGVPPVSANLLLDGVGDAVAIGVQRVEIIRGVVLRVGPVDILLPVTHPSVVGVGDVPHGVVRIQGPVAPHAEIQGASGGVLEVVVQPVAVTVQIIVTGDAGICLVEYLIQVVDTVAVGVGHVRQRQVPPGAQKLLPVGQTVAIGIWIVIVAVRLVECPGGSVPAPREIEEDHG